MKKNIEQALAAFSYDEQRRMRDVITALDNGKVYSVEFYSDGSGVSFEYYHPTINHGCPGTLASSFRTEQAMIILAAGESNMKSPFIHTQRQFFGILNEFNGIIR